MILSNCDEISLVPTLQIEHTSYLFDSVLYANLHISSKNVLCVKHNVHICHLSVCVNVLLTTEDTSKLMHYHVCLYTDVSIFFYRCEL